MSGAETLIVANTIAAMQAHIEKLTVARYSVYDPAVAIAQSLAATPPPEMEAVPPLAVWYGEMPESNGRRNWTASLHRRDGCIHLDGFCFARSEYPDRVRYEADRMRWIIGDLADKPDILAYDADLHSGYASPHDIDALPSIAAALVRIADTMDGTTAGICVTETLIGGQAHGR
jgi:hypothetical protein